MLIRFDQNDALIGVGILCVLLLVLWRRKRSLSYILFFSIFWIYLLVIVSIVIFPFTIKTDTSGLSFIPSINLIPFHFGHCSMFRLCLVEIAGNIILTIPLGFGINFLVRFKMRDFFWVALVVGLGFELSQFVISIVFRSGFRTIDINDAMLNATGVLIGYSLFRAFALVYLQIAKYFEIENKWLLADIYDIAFQAQASRRSRNA